MKLFTKQLIKALLFRAGIDLTQNQRYDRQTLRIMQKVLKPGSNCIDVGCHKGELLDTMLQLAPNGHHHAFEPIPVMYNRLLQKYKHKNCSIYPYALDCETGTATFNYVVNAPAYSGLKQRKYAIAHPEIEIITVNKEKLDNIIPANTRIDFIKIDVEGAEFNVLKGAENTIKNNKPVVIFEFGRGASEFYGTSADLLYRYITQTLGLRIFVMSALLNNKPPLTINEFEQQYNKGNNYYFVALP